MYDRCLLCHGTLTFYGISIRPSWHRWLFCSKDETFFCTDQFGNVELFTKRLPDNAYFVNQRNEQ